jgi:hypothetical protein
MASRRLGANSKTVHFLTKWSVFLLRPVAAFFLQADGLLSPKWNKQDALLQASDTVTTVWWRERMLGRSSEPNTGARPIRHNGLEKGGGFVL